MTNTKTTETSACWVSTEDSPDAHATLEITHPEGQLPTELIDELRELGWHTDADRGLRGLPPLDGVEITNVNKHGAGLFGGWDPDEAEPFKNEAEQVLAAHGLTNIEHYLLDPMACI